MKVLTYTWYKEHCDLYTEIHGSVAVNSCQIGLAQKDIILLSSISVIFYKAGARTGAGNNKFIKFSLSASTYSIDDFDAKIKVAVLQQRQDWVPNKIKDLDLSYQNTTHLWPPISFLLRLVYLINILKRPR